jgi:hypothetical protein
VFDTQKTGARNPAASNLSPAYDRTPQRQIGELREEHPDAEGTESTPNKVLNNRKNPRSLNGRKVPCSAGMKMARSRLFQS